MTIEETIRQIHTAINSVDSELDELDVVIEKIELEINATASCDLGGGFTWGPIKVGANLTQTLVSKIKMNFKPSDDDVETMAPQVQQGLEEGLRLLINGVIASVESGRYGFVSGAVDVAFIIDDDAQIQIVGNGYDGSAEKTHRAVIHLIAENEA